MSNALLIQIANLAAAGFLIWLAYALGFRGKRRIQGEAEMQALSAPHGGAREIVVDAGGKAAIALLTNGRLLVAKVMGEQITTRIFEKDAIASIDVQRKKGLRILVRFKDFGFSSLRLEMMDSTPPIWLDHYRDRVGNI